MWAFSPSLVGFPKIMLPWMKFEMFDLFLVTATPEKISNGQVIFGRPWGSGDGVHFGRMHSDHHR